MMKNSNGCILFYLHANEIRLIRLLREMKRGTQIMVKLVDDDTIEVAKLTQAGRYVNTTGALVDMSSDQI